MADVLTVVFRTFMSQTGLGKQPPVSPPPPAAGSSLLLGDRSLSRSVLLLAAVTVASELGMRVMFFTQTQIQSLPVSLQRCFPNLSPESLKVLGNQGSLMRGWGAGTRPSWTSAENMDVLECLESSSQCIDGFTSKSSTLRPRTLDELLQQVASLHESTNTSPTPPSLIIVDRLEGFLCSAGGSSSHSGSHPAELSSAAHLSALLCDTAAFLTQVLEQRGSSSGPCRLIASFLSEVDTGRASRDPSGADPILNVLDRYFQVRCTLDRDGGYEAAAAGVQEVWHIYLSGRGMAEASFAKDSEDKPGVAQEWQLLVFPDGLMEFKLV